MVLSWKKYEKFSLSFHLDMMDTAMKTNSISHIHKKSPMLTMLVLTNKSNSSVWLELEENTSSKGWKSQCLYPYPPYCASSPSSNIENPMKKTLSWSAAGPLKYFESFCLITFHQWLLEDKHLWISWEHLIMKGHAQLTLNSVWLSLHSSFLSIKIWKNYLYLPFLSWSHLCYRDSTLNSSSIPPLSKHIAHLVQVTEMGTWSWLAQSQYPNP